MDVRENAMQLHDLKFNCAQSVFAALAEKVGLDRETALKTAACFGGGMRCGEVCGAVTGALMALGVRFGSAKENDPEGKEAAGIRAAAFLEKFREKYGSILCKELLGFNPGIPGDAEKIRELGLRAKVCHPAIADAAQIAAEMIRQG